MYFYHGMPNPMIGTKLIPLNRMPISMCDIRALHLSKYVGREEILKRRVPLLNCLWNDVVQLLPLHPRKIFEKQVNLGLLNEMPEYAFFQIDVRTLDPDITVVYFKNAPGEESVVVKWLRDVDLNSLQEVPPATTHYYESLVGLNEPPFNYQFVPHILHMGEIDVTHATRITI